ncbi:uncharacterized protein LOC119505256 [Choloepus didactylus]|uniref:uncharacterized protein LOC119505256 n=1 Tax=Choloepus didactylus TaxID=27675 RepID=UPI00189F1503|nr:uncharacterized protein LOC119505256 [Choloepus didactylus]
MAFGYLSGDIYSTGRSRNILGSICYFHSQMRFQCACSHLLKCSTPGAKAASLAHLVPSVWAASSVLLQCKWLLQYPITAVCTASSIQLLQCGQLQQWQAPAVQVASTAPNYCSVHSLQHPAPAAWAASPVPAHVMWLASPASGSCIAGSFSSTDANSSELPEASSSTAFGWFCSKVSLAHSKPQSGEENSKQDDRIVSVN